MGKFDGVLLASDFDNTLVFTEEALVQGLHMPPVPQRNREALEYFMAQGGHFAVSTGRALPAFRPFAPQVPMNAPAVVCNGAGLYDFAEERYVYTAPLDETIRERADALLPLFPAIGCEIYHEDDHVHAIQANPFTRSHQKLTHIQYEEVSSATLATGTCTKLLFEGEMAALMALQAALESRGWAEDYELIYSSSHLLELTTKGAHKGGMVQRLAALLGVARQHIYCIGDHANDIPMLEISAIPFAPENAIDAVKSVPGIRVVSHCREGAVADVVAALDKRY